jgi:hypothetical protein
VSREQTQALNERIIEDYYEEGVSYLGLSAKYGRSASTVAKLLGVYAKQYRAEHGHDRPRKKKPADPRAKLEDGKDAPAVSWMHYMVGMHINRFMSEHQLTPTGFGMLLTPNATAIRVQRMSKGRHNFTLEELQSISQVTGIAVPRLIKGKRTPVHLGEPERCDECGHELRPTRVEVLTRQLRA